MLTSDRDRAMFLLSCPEKERKLLQTQMRVITPIIGDIPMSFELVVDRAMKRAEQRRKDRETVQTRRIPITGG